MKAGNVISGKEGRLFLSGQEMAHLKSFKATVEKKKTAIPLLGQRWESHKASGLSGKGTMVFYKVTSDFVAMIVEYANTGIDQYFDVQSVLDDPTAGRGEERVILRNVNFDSVDVGQLDVEKEALEEEMPFTFEGLELPDRLKSAADGL